MKKFRKLIPALCMLLVSALFVGTSTYAWFSMNKEVSATNMSVTAKAENPYLLISKTAADATDFATKVAMDKAGTDLNLVRPLNENKNTLINYYADAAAATAKTETTPTAATNSASLLWGSTTSSDPSKVEESNVTTLVPTANLENKYYISQKLYLKVVDDGANGTNLVASCKLNGTTANSIASSVRVLLMTENGKYVIFDKDGAVKGGNANLAETLTAKNTQNNIAGTVETVTVYMYFDGTDTAAYTNNATNLSSVAVDLTFKID